MTKAKIILIAVGASVGAVIILGLAYIITVGKPTTYFDYFVLDIVFLPLQVVIVSIIIERLLHEREKRALIKKLNMVVGAFFSEAGNELLDQISAFCPGREEFASLLRIDSTWNDMSFAHAAQAVAHADIHPLPTPADLARLHDLLHQHRLFILALLQNPNLLEHDAFTDLLWALTHLAEELAARPGFDQLPAPDLAHLNADISRALSILIREWLAYMQHLRSDYPYIYSLSLRTNPFNPHRSPIINPEPSSS
jgi:hypothetical protein